jgi:quercetin dioxygenase-like cupin family protein
MKLAARQLFLLLLAVVGAAWAVRASTQDAAATRRTPQFENDEVKVWKTVVVPGSPLPLHRHEHPRVIVALVGGTMRISEQSGVSETQEWQSGKAYWLPAPLTGSVESEARGDVAAQPIGAVSRGC